MQLKLHCGVNYTHMNAIVDQSQSAVLESHVYMKNYVSRASNESQWQVREHDGRRETLGKNRSRNPDRRVACELSHADG